MFRLIDAASTARVASSLELALECWLERGRTATTLDVVVCSIYVAHPHTRARVLLWVLPLLCTRCRFARWVTGQHQPVKAPGEEVRVRECTLQCIDAVYRQELFQVPCDWLLSCVVSSAALEMTLPRSLPTFDSRFRTLTPPPSNASVLGTSPSS